MEENNSKSTMNVIFSLLLLVGGIIVFFFVAKILFKVILWGTLILAAIVLVMNYKLVFRYLKKLGSVYKKSPLSGFGLTILSAVCLPIIVLVMFGQTMLERKGAKFIRQSKAQHEAPQEGEYTEYIEIETSRNDTEEF